MRRLILSAAVVITINASAQNNTVSNIIEGGKTLVDLVRVFKAPRYTMQAPAIVEKKDSCSLKNVSDLSFKNSTDKGLYITLYKRNGSAYEPNVLTMKVLPKAQEILYELRSGIYKFKIEIDGEDDERIVYREGEMKLNACENIIKEIRF
ncbi:MAG TPA: hypothetical protein VK489_14550 [Ferruginibacter sp.]|nr:hypothetical protein [Ferruginibacter sp.]